MLELKDIPLFSNLKEYDLSNLQSHMIVHKYDKDSVVFYEGDESDYVHVLLDGMVRLYKTSPKGTQVYMHRFTAPDLIAIFVTFEGMAFPATCEFTTEGVVGLIPIEEIYRSLKDVNFSLALINALSKRMKMLAELLHKETIYSSEAKIADILKTNPLLFERFKNNEIASMLNMTPETLSRILTKLKKANIISIEQHVVKILDSKALEEVIDTNTIQK